MARSITEIYNAIITEKETFSELDALVPNPDDAQTFLDDLTTPSKVSIWRLHYWVMATAVWLHEVLFDKHKEEIEAIAASVVPGTLRWYVDQALEYQHGDVLTWDGEKFVYDPIDEAAMIVKRAAALEVGSQVRIKVAKLVADVPAKLSAPEKDAFSAYMNLIKFAGTDLAVISEDADLLWIKYKVYYDPLVMAADGSLISDAAVFPVEDAINNFISNLYFNGTLDLTLLTDAVQQAEGVVSPFLTQAKAKYGLLPYSTFTEFYEAFAGYMEIDPAHPLSTEITYEPSV